MDKIIEFCNSNKEWLFSGLGVTMIIGVSKYFPRLIQDDKDKTTIRQNNSPSINILVKNSNTTPSNMENLQPTSESNKNFTKILFIDDNHTDYRMVSILKKSGYPLTKSVKDITDLGDPKLKESDIIFVDINGVGITLFSDQGLGLASALKNKYPEKKIILYSAESNGDRFHKALREVDGCLNKDAEPYQFISKIEELTNV